MLKAVRATQEETRSVADNSRHAVGLGDRASSDTACEAAKAEQEAMGFPAQQHQALPLLLFGDGLVGCLGPLLVAQGLRLRPLLLKARSDRARNRLVLDLDH
jgi:hypothetical protein